MNVKAFVIDKIKGGLDPNVAVKNMPDEIKADLAVELIRLKADPREVLKSMGSLDIWVYLEEILAAGAPADEVAQRILLHGPKVLDLLERYGASAEVLIESRGGYVLENLDWLCRHGYRDYLDLEALITKSSISEVASYLRSLLYAGVDLDVLMAKLGSVRVAERLDLLYDAGATVEMLVKALEPIERLRHFRWLVGHGAEIDPNHEVGKIVGQIGKIDDAELDVLLLYGADPFGLALVLEPQARLAALPLLAKYWRDFSISIRRILSDEEVVSNLRMLEEIGLKPSREELRRAVRRVSSWQIQLNFASLLDAGEDFYYLLSLMTQSEVDVGLTSIAKYEGLMPDEKQFLLARASPSSVVRSLGSLREHGFKVDTRKLFSELPFADREAHLRELCVDEAELGIFNLGEMVGLFSSGQFDKYFDLLIAGGVDPDILVNGASEWTVYEYLETLLEIGANPNIVALKVLSRLTDEDKEILLAHGATMWLT